jgi:hypothetical protein
VQGNRFVRGLDLAFFTFLSSFLFLLFSSSFSSDPLNLTQGNSNVRLEGLVYIIYRRSDGPAVQGNSYVSAG